MQPNKRTDYEMISDFPQKRKNYWQVDRMDKARGAHPPPSLSLFFLFLLFCSYTAIVVAPVEESHRNS